MSSCDFSHKLTRGFILNCTKGLYCIPVTQLKRAGIALTGLAPPKLHLTGQCFRDNRAGGTFYTHGVDTGFYFQAGDQIFRPSKQTNGYILL